MTAPLASPFPVTCTVYPPGAAPGVARRSALSRLAAGRSKAPTDRNAAAIAAAPPQLSFESIADEFPAAKNVITGSGSTPGTLNGGWASVGPTARITTASGSPDPTTAPIVRIFAPAPACVRIDRLMRRPASSGESSSTASVTGSLRAEVIEFVATQVYVPAAESGAFLTT